MVRQLALIFQLRKDGFRWIDAWRFARAFRARAGVIGPRRFPMRGEVIYPGSELYEGK